MTHPRIPKAIITTVKSAVAENATSNQLMQQLEVNLRDVAAQVFNIYTISENKAVRDAVSAIWDELFGGNDDERKSA